MPSSYAYYNATPNAPARGIRKQYEQKILNLLACVVADITSVAVGGEVSPYQERLLLNLREMVAHYALVSGKGHHEIMSTAHKQLAQRILEV